MVYIGYQQEVLHGLFKEPILEPIKFKMTDGRTIENRFLAITQQSIADIS